MEWLITILSFIFNLIAQIFPNLGGLLGGILGIFG